MCIDLIVDYREICCKNILSDISIEWKNLIHGDFLITHNNEILAIFERKNIADLLSSIKDGRYRNQKVEMLKHIERSHIYYIIEGDLDFGFPQDKIVLNSIINMMIRDDLKVFVTKDVQDTCDLLRRIYNKVRDDPDKYLRGHTNEIIIKKNPASKTDFLKSALVQVPGVSNKIANDICNKYHSFCAFYNDFHIKSRDEKLKALKAILNNKPRSVSSTTLNNIIKYIFQDNIEENVTFPIE